MAVGYWTQLDHWDRNGEARYHVDTVRVTIENPLPREQLTTSTWRNGCSGRLSFRILCHPVALSRRILQQMSTT